MATSTQVELLPEVVDERAGSRWREATMASLILHLGFVILILVNPKFLQSLGPKPLPPEVAEEMARRQLTLLYIPSDLLKIPEPRKEELTPEERKRAVIRTPFTVDPQEFRRILPMLTEPAEPRPPGQNPELPVPGVPEPGEAQRRAERGGQAREERRTEIVRLENIPERTNEKPRLELPQGTAGQAIEDSLRAGLDRQGRQPSESGGGLPSLPNFNAPYPIILSDTRGVDFGPYLARLVYDVRKNWYAVIPEAARLGRRGRVVIVFAVQQDGSVPVGQPALVRSSEFLPYDRAAMGAIRGSQPFSPLPAEFTGEQIVLQFTFLYNLPLDYQEP
ncbi:MAG: TonB family protein [Acidobacteria bacterium]|nr:TonB family protein [Acidobacteriota bacterium]